MRYSPPHPRIMRKRDESAKDLNVSCCSSIERIIPGEIGGKKERSEK
jgi:hypothetical protein